MGQMSYLHPLLRSTQQAWEVGMFASIAQMGRWGRRQRPHSKPNPILHGRLSSPPPLPNASSLPIINLLLLRFNFHNYPEQFISTLGWLCSTQQNKGQA